MPGACTTAVEHVYSPVFGPMKVMYSFLIDFGALSTRTRTVLLVTRYRQLCTGEAGVGKVYKKPMTYKGSAFHRIIPQVRYTAACFRFG